MELLRLHDLPQREHYFKANQSGKLAQHSTLIAAASLSERNVNKSALFTPRLQLPAGNYFLLHNYFPDTGWFFFTGKITKSLTRQFVRTLHMITQLPDPEENENKSPQRLVLPLPHRRKGIQSHTRTTTAAKLRSDDFRYLPAIDCNCLTGIDKNSPSRGESATFPTET